MPVAVIDFAQALEETRECKRHLLLGNGFSIGLFPDRFRYGSLFDEADFSSYPEVKQSFIELKTSDFELVIQALRQSATLLPLYSTDSLTANRMNHHAEAVKELLIQAIAGKHPERPTEIASKQYHSCREFLGHFAGEHRRKHQACIYTLNYDLLLYWVLLHDDSFTVDHLKHDDGFRASHEEPDAEYVVWDGEEARQQNIHYLHGALHLYDCGHELRKKCWERSGQQALVDQIRVELTTGKFPLYVSEGTSDSKLDRINHSGYLHRCLRSFRGICDARNTSLFVFGHSLAENDRHVLNAIARGKIPRLYVSLYGDPESEFNRFIISQAEKLVRQRDEDCPLSLTFYSAESARVWDKH